MFCVRCKDVQLNATRLRASGVIVDVCPSCKGIWFDANELDAVLDVAARDLQVPSHEQHAPTALCPKCQIPMACFNYPQTLALIDMCRECQGIWLDKGEFEEIHLIRSKLKEQAHLEEFAPMPGLKGALLRFINGALSRLTDYS